MQITAINVIFFVILWEGGIRQQYFVMLLLPLPLMLAGVLLLLPEDEGTDESGGDRPSDTMASSC